MSLILNDMNSENDMKTGMNNCRSAYSDDMDWEQRKDFYGKWAQDGTYEKEMNAGQYKGPYLVANALHKHISNMADTARVLDVGAGTGLVAIELRKLGFHNLDALEPVTSMLETSKERKLYHNHYNVAVGDLNSTPIADDTYDGIVMSAVIGNGHLKKEAFKEMIRIVKPGGYICSATRKEYMDHPSYGGLDDYCRTLQTQGKWKLVEQRQDNNYGFNRTGTVIVFQVLDNGFKPLNTA